MAYISKRTGKEVDELLDKVERGGTGGGGNSDNNYTDADKALVQTIPNKVDKVEGKGLSTNDFTNEDKERVDTIPNLVTTLRAKANKEGYYPDMSVGMADNLVGRGDVQDAQINFRPSAGEANITDHAARIERIKGNSVVWNQRHSTPYTIDHANLQNPTFMYYYGTNLESYTYADGVATLVGKPNLSSGVNFASRVDVGHKMLTIAKIKCSVADLLIAKASTKASDYTGSYISTDWNEYAIIVDAPSGDWRAGMTVVVANEKQNSHDGYTCEIKDIQQFDLTQMFGAGNEPTTVEEYYQRKPMNIEDEYADNEGELIDMKVDSLISTSDNAYAYTKGYARVMGGQTYDCSYGTAFVEKVYFSTNKDNIVAEENVMTSDDGKYTFPSDGYAVPYTTDGDVREYCVCLQHSYTKPHPAHQQDVKDLSFIGEAFSEGMRSVPQLSAKTESKPFVVNGVVCDEIRFNPTEKIWEKVTRIKAVNLGDLNWIDFDYQGTNVFRTNDVVDSKRHSTYLRLTGSIIPIYQQVMALREVVLSDKTYTLNSVKHGANLFAIYDTQYSTAAEFKQAMQEQGVKLYYELAEPIVEDIDLSPNFNLDYFAWDFGTEEAIASVPSAPFRADINYEPNAVDDLRWAVSEIRKLQAQLAQMQTSVTNLTE